MPSACLLVIPCFRESARLPHFLPELARRLSDSALDVSILVVDDGSGSAEATRLAAFVDTLRPAFPRLLPVLQLPANQGKGGAVYAGWDTAADEQFLAFVDADGAVPATEVVRLFDILQEKPTPPPALYAVRVHGAGRHLSRTFVRSITGLVFRRLVHFFFPLPVPDTQCGFKIVPASAYRAFRGELREHRFCFDVELTCQLMIHGTRVDWEPIDWHESPGSRVRPNTIREMFLGLLRLRRRLDWGK